MSEEGLGSDIDKRLAPINNFVANTLYLIVHISTYNYHIPNCVFMGVQRFVQQWVNFNVKNPIWDEIFEKINKESLLNITGNSI